jgi:hypothetical protein
MSRNRLVLVRDLAAETRTRKAVKIVQLGRPGDEQWLPTSLLERDRIETEGTVEMPAWLAEEKELEFEEL